MARPQLDTIVGRAHWAYHCLYDQFGNRPTARALERDFRIGHSALQKLLKGTTKNPGAPNTEKIASALRVDPSWLMFGFGEIPKVNPYAPQYEGAPATRPSEPPPASSEVAIKSGRKDVKLMQAVNRQKPK